MATLRLGCIADDFTGATDLAGNLVRAGLRVVQTIGVPRGPLGEEVDAVVVALKSRTIPADEAVAQSLAALAWLREAGAQQAYFKYCSTFDSTPRGNIGPVAEALMAALGTDFTIACPAFPENGRTVYKGYLFAGDVPLDESGMKDHPLTPMNDANLVRVMQAQSKGRVGLVDYRTVAAGPEAIRARFDVLRREGVSIAIVDAISDADLHRLGTALAGMPLVTAGSGVAIGLAANWGIAPAAQAATLPAPTGFRAIVSGSCSVATRAQVAAFIASGGRAFALDPDALSADSGHADMLAAAAADSLSQGPVLVYSTADPEAVRALQRRLGVDHAGTLVEAALARMARHLVERGVRQLVVAGGETSGAVVQALGVDCLRIGPAIDPGVPWCAASSPVAGGTVHLALKSGNFGSEGFFDKAFERLAALA
ncbi:MAG: four-carbon acid sugar kinase family protein [Betaproteobacteria bacterium]|nr:four-carbon acid sugar kinase family protein [Betaproteobacteria bacterium]